MSNSGLNEHRVFLTVQGRETHQIIWIQIEGGKTTLLCRCGKVITKDSMDESYLAFNRHHRSSLAARARWDRRLVEAK